MIKQNEIRIGNWFNHDEKWSYRNEKLENFNFQFEPADWYAISECRLSLEQLNPIPLTEDWLLEMGFELIKRKGRYGNIYALGIHDYRLCVERDFNKHTSYFFGVEYTDSPDDKDNDTTYNFSYELKYVHELQNLFFSITKEELI